MIEHKGINNCEGKTKTSFSKADNIVGAERGERITCQQSWDLSAPAVC